MADLFYVLVKLAGNEWEFTEDPAGSLVADDFTVLAGMRFGWEMAGALWPAQPDPMTASLTLSVPEFVAAQLQSDPDQVDTLVIEVRQGFTMTPLVASFYGDVTDYSAMPRGGTRPGMYVSVVAVDYTVRLREVKAWAGLPGLFFPLLDRNVIDSVWADPSAGFGAPGAVSTVVWSAPSREVAPDDVPAAGLPVLSFVEFLLRQSVDAITGRRMVLAPMVDSHGHLMGYDAASPHNRIFTLDVVSTDPADGLSWVLPADMVEMDSMKWSNVRSSIIRKVGAAGKWVFDYIAYSYSTLPELIFVGSTTPIVPVSLQPEEAAIVATYYADRSRFAPWQVDTFTIPITRPDTTPTPAEIPVGLFPDWTLAEDDPDRSLCYSAQVLVTGAQVDVTPDGSGTIEGRVVGATIRFDDGRLSLDLSIRRTRDNPPPGPPTMGALAMVPYASADAP